MKTWSAARLRRAVEDYFMRDGVKSLPGLALHLGMDSETLAARMETEDALQPVFLLAKTRVEREVVENGLRGAYNASLSSFVLKTAFGYREKGEPKPAGLSVELADELRQYAG